MPSLPSTSQYKLWQAVPFTLLKMKNLSKVALHLEVSIYVNKSDNKLDDSAYIEQRITASLANL